MDQDFDEVSAIRQQVIVVEFLFIAIVFFVPVFPFWSPKGTLRLEWQG